VAVRTKTFEIHGRSDPSEKVGGDLVDVVQLEGGSTVAYLADIAGSWAAGGNSDGVGEDCGVDGVAGAVYTHAGGEIRRSAGTAESRTAGCEGVQMYAAFVGFWLNDDGTVLYALAAHSPFLRYRNRENAEWISNGAVSAGASAGDRLFGDADEGGPGDLLVVVTDGILEACDTVESEFGPDRLQQIISDHVPESLPVLTERILATVRAFGKQVDEQTLLLIRRLPADKDQFSARWRHSSLAD
jgi:sigma-B regulation protein RsbU (phosphoserine phosphatase)